GLNEAASGVRVVIRDLLFNLTDTKAVRDEFVRVKTHLVLTGGTAEGVGVHDARHRLDILLDDPVLNGFEVHHVEFRIVAAQRVEVDLAHRAPVCAHLWHDPIRQSHLREAFQYAFAVLEVGGFFTEDHFDGGKSEDGPRTDVRNTRDAVHHRFQRNRYLLLDLFSRNPRPLRDHVNVVVRDV